jgi:hypothetical protein
VCKKFCAITPAADSLYQQIKSLIYKEKDTIEIRVATLGINSAISPTCYLVPNLN